MKKIICLALALVMCLGLFAACGKNNSTNNIMSVEFGKSVGGFATTQIATNMYLQAGAPTNANPNSPAKDKDTNRQASAAMDEFDTFTYDMNFLAHCGRNWTGSYSDMVAAVLQAPNGCGGNNWNWFGGAGSEIVSMYFHVLGAFSGSRQKQYGSNYYYACDTRDLIKEGNSIEIDYIIFGSTPEQLDEWKSYAEQNIVIAIDESDVADSSALASAIAAASSSIAAAEAVN